MNWKANVTSLYKRYMISFGLLVIFSFSILGGIFFYQINSLAIEEKQLILSDTVQKTVESSKSYLDTRREISSFLAIQALDNNYKVNLMQLASYSGAYIFITDKDGLIQRTASPGNFIEGDGVTSIPSTAILAAVQQGRFTDMGTISGFLSEAHFTSGMPVYNYDGTVEALVFVSIPAEASLRFSQNMLKTFFGFLALIVTITLIVTYFIARQTAEPIVAMSKSAQSFARGDFSKRVKLPHIHDELYVLTNSFNSMADELMKAESERSGLIANVSHDLRTPMTTISGFVDAMLDGTIRPENQKAYLQIISDEVKRLSRLANDMVELSRFQSDNFEFNYSNFDLTEVLRRIVISFEQKIVEKKMDIEMDIPDVLTVCADRDSIFRVVYNLTDNAVKFTNEGGTMSFKVSHSGGKAIVSIKNTGNPIPPDEAKSVFERFYKVDKSRSENKQGAGLGLYIAKTIVNKHGGDIYAESLSDGTKFTFILPIKGQQDEI